jgi:hypothetical protein
VHFHNQQHWAFKSIAWHFSMSSKHTCSLCLALLTPSFLTLHSHLCAARGAPHPPQQTCLSRSYPREREHGSRRRSEDKNSLTLSSPPRPPRAHASPPPNCDETRNPSRQLPRSSAPHVFAHMPSSPSTRLDQPSEKRGQHAVVAAEPFLPSEAF